MYGYQGMGRINWEIGIDIYTLLLLLCDIHMLLSIKLTTNKDLMYSTRNSIQYSVMAYKEKNLEKSTYMYMWGIPGGASCKEPACQCRRRKRCRFNPWDTTIPRRRAWQPTPVFLPRESHGQRSLVGYNPKGCRARQPKSKHTGKLDTQNYLILHLLNFEILEYISLICCFSISLHL